MIFIVKNLFIFQNMKNPTISIKNIDIHSIDRKYNFVIFQNENREKTSVSKTKITEISKEKQIRKLDGFSYIDEAKKEHICHVTMRNSTTKEILPEVSSTINCYWCRHTFNTRVIGCPIDYKCSMIYKKYYSEITKNNYCLQESLTNKQKTTNCKDTPENDFHLDFMKNSYYITDGMFCSFNCCIAFIHDNGKNPLYRKSSTLLNKMYFELFQTQQKITPAPNWRLLKSYGGHLTIQDFRKGFYKIEYINNEDYIVPSDIPIFKSIGMVFEKKIKL